MGNSFFVVEVEREKIRYWELRRRRGIDILKKGELSLDKNKISEIINPNKDVYLFFAPTLVSNITLNLPNLKEKFVLAHILSYKDKYFPIPSERPLIKYFKVKNGEYMVFAIDEAFWNKVISLFPNKKRIYGPLYWAFIPILLKLNGIFKKDERTLSEYLKLERGEILLYKKGPKVQIDSILNEQVGHITDLSGERFTELFKYRIKKSVLSSYIFEEIKIKEKRTGLYLAIFLIILIFILFTGKILREKALLKFEIAKLESNIEKVKDRANIIEGKKKKMEKMREVISSYNSILTFDSHALELLRVLSQILPKDAHIEYLELEGNIIKDLEGTTGNATKLLVSLQKDKRFSEMRFKGPVTRENGVDRFSIEGRFLK